MMLDADSVWTLTTKPLTPGAYRYHFLIDGVRVLDPINTKMSPSNSNVWSMVVVPGDDRFDIQDVPHGALAQVTYYSETLSTWRRMHVYTPPGYEGGPEAYPVFYLLHGAWDNDAAWPTVGRANVIFDNLIASGQAVPMIVVMPDGHTGPFDGGGGFPGIQHHVKTFTDDFIQEIRPYIEANYRVKEGRANRALAGLSMGGAQTLAIGMRQLADYAHLGVFSSGIFELRDLEGGPAWEAEHKAVLEDASLRDGLETLWFAIGTDDFLLDTSRRTVALLRQYGFTVEEVETKGGHTWLKWRDYLATFTPMLFQERGR